MLPWACKASFTNCNRRTIEETFFHATPGKMAGTQMKSVTHVYARFVTHVRA
jgi:hypothetical protein